MYTLGIHGGINTIGSFRVGTPLNWMHDASAVLCRDGEVVAASEEERFVRIKHVNYFPLEAIRYCLESTQIGLKQVHTIVLTSTHMNTFVGMVNHWQFGTTSWLHPQKFATIAARILHEAFDVEVGGKIICAGHHRSHALSAIHQSGFDDCLCVILDGWGDGLTGMVLSYRDGQTEVVRILNEAGPASMYRQGTELIGFSQFDEYKVMGLAPYGDARKTAVFGKLVTLRPNGDFIIRRVPSAEPGELQTLQANPQSVSKDLRVDIETAREFLSFRRMPSEPLEQRHKDFASALQKSTEGILLHLLSHLRQLTDHSNLCLAGGLAQNCSATGKVLSSHLFENVFVQPAAYDAGCSIGAAIHGYLESGGIMRSKNLKNVYWGYDVGDACELSFFLESWSHVVDIDHPADICAASARLIAAGSVVAWVQSKAEFGARALGNRSIVADPRPAENRERINAMVKKREAFRPFAPSVLEEHLHEYFEVPPTTKSLPFMVFVVQVKEEYRSVLKAITHVDGSARVQSVSRETNERYWLLIENFRLLTGIPLVLNTSFNNNHEPIVNTALDALNCFLSTKIDYLVIDRVLISRKPNLPVGSILRRLVPQLNHRFDLVHQSGRDGRLGCYAYDRYLNEYIAISTAAFESLLHAVQQSVRLECAMSDQSRSAELTAELFRLWERRVFTCHPQGASPTT